MSEPKPRALASPGFSFSLVFLATVAFVLSLPAFNYFSADRSIAAIGVLLLFTIELPLYFWLIVLRRSGTHPLYAVPVAAVGYLFCRWWIQGETSDWIAWGWIALAPLEALLLVIIARRALHVVRTARELPRSCDLIERLSLAAEQEFPANRWTAMLAYEVGLIHYALGGRPGIVLGSMDVAFTYHRRSGLRVIYAVALVIGAAEIVGLHLLVAALSPVAAWVLTGFELYGIVWVIGLLRSVSGLPIVLGERGIQVRLGVLYTLFVPYEAIETVQWHRLHTVDSRRGNYLNCAFMNSPDCVLKLRTTTRARLPYTLSKIVDEIGLMVDEPKAFQAQLERRIAARDE
jgi:hypothetical protein